MKKIKSTIFYVLVLLIIALFLTSCNNNNNNNNNEDNDLSQHPLYKTYVFSNDEKIIYMGDQPLWSSTSAITTFMKKDKILKEELEKQGYKLITYPFLKGNDVNYFLKSGDLDIGIGGDMPAIRAAATDDISVISLIQEGPIFTISKNIREVKNLKGKKIAYALGSNAHFYLLNTLNQHKISLSDVELVPMDVNEMIEALDRDEIDAFSAWEHTPTLALEKNPELLVTHKGRSYGFIYVKNKLLQDNPEIVKLFLASEIRALAWLRDENSNMQIAGSWVIKAINEISAENIGLSKQSIVKIIQEDSPGLLPKTYPRIQDRLLTDTGAIKKEFEFLKEVKLISPNKEWEDIKEKFELDLIEEVIENPEKYRLNEITSISQ